MTGENLNNYKNLRSLFCNSIKMPQIRFMEKTRVFDVLDDLKETSNKKDILNCKESSAKEKKWISYSISDFVDNVNYVTAGLLALGLQKNDVAAIMANNRPEWNFVDYGAQQAAMPTVPIFPTIGAEDLKFILNHSEAKIIFISDKGIYQKLVSMETDLPALKFVYSFNKIEGVKHFSELIELGKEKLDLDKISAIKATISENDLFTILY